MHEPIICREDFCRVQLKRKGRRQRKSKTKRNIFSGLLRCADCGARLSFHFNQKNKEITYYNCPANDALNKKCSSTHYVRADFLEQVVLKDIRRMVKYASINEADFVKRLMDAAGKSHQTSKQTMEVQLEGYTKRHMQLDNLFKQIYEDQVLGIITLDRMRKMAADFETEQNELDLKINELQESIAQVERQDVSFENFVEQVRKHSQIKRLTKSLLNQFIDYIVVHQSEKVDGRWVQKLDIFYNCVGIIDLSDVDELPAPVVQMKTRKGVVITNEQPQQHLAMAS
jgi:hypothetical protein